MRRRTVRNFGMPESMQVLSDGRAIAAGSTEKALMGIERDDSRLKTLETCIRLILCASPAIKNDKRSLFDAFSENHRRTSATVSPRTHISMVPEYAYIWMVCFYVCTYVYILYIVSMRMYVLIIVSIRLRTLGPVRYMNRQQDRH